MLKNLCDRKIESFYLSRSNYFDNIKIWNALSRLLQSLLIFERKVLFTRSSVAVTLCIHLAHVFANSHGSIASRVDAGINRARDYSLTRSYTPTGPSQNIMPTGCRVNNSARE